MNIDDEVKIHTEDSYKGKTGVIKYINDKTSYNVGVMLDEPNRGMIVWFSESELEMIK